MFDVQSLSSVQLVDLWKEKHSQIVAGRVTGRLTSSELSSLQRELDLMEEQINRRMSY